MKSCSPAPPSKPASRVKNNSEEAGEKLCFPFLFRNTKLFFFADACFVPLFLFTEEREQGRHALLVPVHGAQARK